jgi:uncharacterized protein YwqG
VVTGGGHDRRSFLRELLRGASRAAAEVETLRRGADDALRQSIREGEREAGALELRPAAPTQRLAAVEEVRSLCVELGHAEWADEAASLARTGFRLTPGGSGRSWLGGSPGVAATFTWPRWDDVELEFLARVALEELPPSPLPSSGTLLVFYALDRAPSGLEPAHADACHVMHVDDDADDDTEDVSGLRLIPSGELTLPADPSFPVDVWELEDWSELRERLAASQGVELDERTAEYHALHRMLGHADTYAAGMELDAELVSRGVDLDADPYTQLRDEEHAHAAPGWTLLLQLSSDAALGKVFEDGARLFVWIRDQDLAAGRFDAVRAFLR